MKYFNLKMLLHWWPDLSFICFEYLYLQSIYKTNYNNNFKKLVDSWKIDNNNNYFKKLIDSWKIDITLFM